MIISPSALAIKALGLSAEGTMDCPEETQCAVCGAKIAVGERIDDLALPPSFTNHATLAHPGGKYRCGACTAVMTRKEFQMGLSTALVSAAGYFPIIRKENRAWAFLTPPEPPFAICIQNAQQQHTVWRAPVSLSKDLLLVRVGEQVVRLRRRYLVAARETALMLNDKRAEMLAAEKRQRGRPLGADPESPFLNDWKLQSAVGGRLKGWVPPLLKHGYVTPEDLLPIEQLNGGEAWALTAVLHLNPVQPEPIKL